MSAGCAHKHMHVRWEQGGAVHARWRGITLCHDCGLVQLSFQMADGSVCRLLLTPEAQQELRRVLAGYLDIVSHSERSSGNPQSAVSIPEDGENVCPPDRSSSACRGDA